jgi:hypothetical protein
MSKLTVTSIDTADATTQLVIKTGNTSGPQMTVESSNSSISILAQEIRIGDSRAYINNVFIGNTRSGITMRRIGATEQLHLIANGTNILEFSKGTNGYPYAYTYEDWFWDGGKIFLRATGDQSNQLVVQTQNGWSQYILFQATTSGGSYSDAKSRWQIGVADAETGSNTGSHLYFHRYTDAGTWLDSPLVIKRDTGIIVTKDIVPWASNTYNIGSSSYRWKNIY